jgi:hypothetical protein
LRGFFIYLANDRIAIMENPTFRKSVAHADGEGGLVIQTAQDVSAIVERNKQEFNSYDERAKWSDELYGNKVASIPLTAIDELNKQGIMRGFHVLDNTRFAMWLNNPDNRAWRTRPGVI